MRKALVGAICILVVAVCFFVYWFRFTNRAIVRNSSGTDIATVMLSLQDLDGEWHVTKKVNLLKPGDALTLRHTKNDTKAKLTYVIKGESKQHKEDYIDLWTNESWVFDIQPDGTVSSGYEYPRQK